jgi:hypothetical protein
LAVAAAGVACLLAGRPDALAQPTAAAAGAAPPSAAPEAEASAPSTAPEAEAPAPSTAPEAEAPPPSAAADLADSAATEPRMLRYPPSSARGWVLGAGIGLTATAYGIGMACGFGWNDVPGADALKVPVVGPWVALGQSGCAPDQDECTAMLVLRTILTTLDGLVQLGGVALVLEGVLMTTEADAPANEKESGGARASARTAPRIAVVPTFTGERGGAVLDLRF